MGYIELLCKQGHYPQAARLFGATEAPYRRIERGLPPRERVENEGAIVEMKAALGEEALPRRMPRARRWPRMKPKPTWQTSLALRRMSLKNNTRVWKDAGGEVNLQSTCKVDDRPRLIMSKGA